MTALLGQATLTDRAILAGSEALAGRRRGLRSLLPFAGPAVIASVAYMDPGNFATNIQAGAKYNYNLLWVVVVANIIAMIFQALSAKLGIVTGRNLAELCREQFPRPMVWGMWVGSEIGAMATDLAEFLGGAIGLSLLLGMPLLLGMVITGIATYAILTLQRGGFRPIELLIGGLVGVIGASYLVELFIAPPDWSAAAFHSVVPRLDGGAAVLLAVGIVGATVMPHAIFLHSGLTQDRVLARTDSERKRLLQFSNREVMLALGLAGLVNIAMVAMAASVFHDGVHDDVAQIDTAYRTLIPVLGSGAAGVFLVSLIASGLSSSAVGTMAGQVIMQGFVGFRIPLWLRRSGAGSQPGRAEPHPAGADDRPAGPDATPRNHGFLRKRTPNDGGGNRRRCHRTHAQSPVGAANGGRTPARVMAHAASACRSSHAGLATPCSKSRWARSCAMASWIASSKSWS